ncbi:MAG: Hsp20/alpha crystallin family protein [Cyclobacteriaceae bacterium]
MSLITRDFPMLTNVSDFFGEDWFPTRMINDWSPAVNVVDNEGQYEIEVAAPGLKKDDFNVEVENGVLTISGKTENEEEEKKKNYTRKEFSSRSFSKSFTLPENVDEEHLNAKYTDGILKLTLTKTEKKLPPKKQILIN